MALLTGLSPLSSSVHQLVEDLDLTAKTWPTYAHQQTEKIESCGASGEGATDVVKRSWESFTEILGGQVDFCWVEKRAGVGESSLLAQRNSMSWRMVLRKEVACSKWRGMETRWRRTCQPGLKNWCKNLSWGF